MAFQDFLKKAQPWIDKTKPLVDKARGYSSQAIDYIGKQVEQTPIFLKTEEEYNIHASSKRAIFVAFDGSSSDAESLRLLMPLWGVQAWTDAAELRYLDVTSNPELARTLRITDPLEMRVSYVGEEFARLHTLDEIKGWWKNRSYAKDTGDTSETSSKIPEGSQDAATDADPLADVEKKGRAKKTPKK